jgi:hypothetical protein
MLREYLETLLDKERIDIFIDELPWLDTPRSRFLKAFDLFWNGWASKHDNIKLIVCGSATTWMTNKLLGDKGGLHNRVTKQIYLRPFNLSETEEFLKLRGFDLSRQHIIEIYMSLGGTPYYLDMMSRSMSVAQNIDALFFSIIKLQANYTSRISHPEPGIPAKQYFKDLREKFTAQASEIIDQINNLH